MIVRIKNGRYKNQSGKIVGATEDGGYRVQIQDSPGIGEIVEVTTDMVEIITAIIQLWRIVRSWFKSKKPKSI